ncbi:kinesin-like protein NACK2 [Mercurialis annua]|uniref:kinesin-like protein NACK2 n=1 Tax=Mercurialis annua TaxID=3986 RepID=UPI00215F652A|nr:kinesin-like protein NACK2 [Mercurialis annua]XP_050219258.1 kinesin-like protein NACK2 [Mercurialis annua]XP_050219259.1 kinesin-like protein NACK2 [Mercurialis annua]
MVGTPTTPACKMMIQRTPSTVPGSVGGGSRAREEKIMVTVRIRPLSRKEQAMYDLIAWECPDDQTIVYKNPSYARPVVPYTFDKVFDVASSTQKVYEEGAKNVALSALTGMNATIFAYGQTSSGKTYTMRGITENAIKDIYEHVKNTQDREFTLRLSALEIYNETVIDLLNRESGPLRLLDDPEKGTIVEKLVEEVVRDTQHLRHLIGICEAQRQVGETSLNDQSSRSHQIIRLTIESSLRGNSGCVKSFLASLNLVDLAGSERASQTNADGTRLKEGSHINRSLLTLTTVIRKLSGGKRSGHIPYRDSKLTRILQHSLGGNARTAIICTISPALRHVEQTRNTLSFATSAKEVTNSAQVNMVVAEKGLVKHLQKEVARLESELRSPEPSSSCLKTLLMKKDLKIEQMEREVKELKRQRDLAQSQLELERTAHKELKGQDQCGPSSQVVRCLSFSNEDEAAIAKHNPEVQLRNVSGRQATIRQSITSTDPSLLVQEIRKLEQLQRQLGDEANRALEVLHKEVSSHRLGSQANTQATTEAIAKMLSEIKDMHVLKSVPEEVVIGDKASLREEITRLNSQESTIASLERKLDNVQKSIEMLVSSYASNEETPEFKSLSKKKKSFPFPLSNSSNRQNIIRYPCSPSSSSQGVVDNEIENRVPETSIPFSGNMARPSEVTPLKSDKSGYSSASREGTPKSQSNSVNVRKLQRMFKNAAEENIQSIRAYVTELKERVAKLQYQKQLLVCQVLELEANETTADEMDNIDESPMPWNLIFEDQRKQIVMLWHLCHVSLIHRTQFYLLFKGDPSDQIYMEVELRRLSWLEQHLSELGNASPALLGDEPAGSVSSSIRALKQEREYLAKRVSTKLTAEERENLYTKWEIPPVGKQRRVQLVNKLWTDPLNMQHIKESAEIVAKLVGFCESGEHASKEMFELNFKNPCDKKTWMGWNLISNLLHL